MNANAAGREPVTWTGKRIAVAVGLAVVAILWLSHADESATAPSGDDGVGSGVMPLDPVPEVELDPYDPTYGGGTPPSADDPSLTPGGSGGVPDTGGYDLSGQPYPGDPSIAPGTGSVPDY
jgi:hypothetical protein